MHHDSMSVNFVRFVHTFPLPYCINEKKAVKMIEDFKIKPSDYKERVDKVISLISTNVDCTRKGIEILQRLVNEVEYLKGAHIQ